MNVARDETRGGSAGYIVAFRSEVCRNENRVGGDRAPYLACYRVAAAALVDRRSIGRGRDHRGDGGLEDIVRIGHRTSGSRSRRTAGTPLTPSTEARIVRAVLRALPSADQHRYWRR